MGRKQKEISCSSFSSLCSVRSTLHRTVRWISGALFCIAAFVWNVGRFKWSFGEYVEKCPRPATFGPQATNGHATQFTKLLYRQINIQRHEALRLGCGGSLSLPESELLQRFVENEPRGYIQCSLWRRRNGRQSANRST